MEKQISLTREAPQRKRTVEPLAAPPSDSPSTVMALIERVALDPSAGVEKLEHLAAIYDRLKAKEAELAFNGAKGRILKRARLGGSNTRRWRRSTNICARCWRKRRWISPIPMNRGTAAAS